jgi:hypothetical protein
MVEKHFLENRFLWEPILYVRSVFQHSLLGDDVHFLTKAPPSHA